MKKLITFAAVPLALLALLLVLFHFGTRNDARGLVQFRNGGATPPQPEDILVLGPSLFNPYGHVAIVAEVNPHAVIVAQQNAGQSTPGPVPASSAAGGEVR